MVKTLSAVLASALVCCQCSAGYAAPKTVMLSVPNMYCATCPITVKKALSRVEGVSDVTVSYPNKQATVTFDDTKTTVDALTKATADAGYPSKPVSGDSQ